MCNTFIFEHDGNDGNDSGPGLVYPYFRACVTNQNDAMRGRGVDSESM